MQDSEEGGPGAVQDCQGLQKAAHAPPAALQEEGQVEEGGGAGDASVAARIL